MRPERKVVLGTRSFASVATVSLSLLVGVGAIVSHARQDGEKEKSGLALTAVANVDMEEVYSKSDALQIVDLATLDASREAQQRLKEVSELIYLTQEEFGEFLILSNNKQPTAEQQARLKALKEMSQQRDAELNRLRTTPQANLTADERKRLSALTDQARFFQAQLLPKAAALYQEEVEIRRSDARNAQMARLRGVVKQIMKEKGFAHVFDNRALVATETDLTPLVLQKLNKKK
jgi:Skp family chaperone for outer membrane proteins